MKVVVLLLVFMLSTIAYASNDFSSGIADMDTFKKTIKEPYKSILSFGLSSVKGFRDGYFKEYHRNMQGKDAEREKKDDALCFSPQSENQLYQIVYFLLKGELVDMFTVWNSTKSFAMDTYRHCGVLETVRTLFRLCSEQGRCGFGNIVTNLYSNYYLLIKLGENLFQIFVSTEVIDSLKSPADAYDFAFDMGADLGEAIVALFGL